MGSLFKERVIGGSILFRSRFSNFLSVLGGVFQFFSTQCPIFKFLSILDQNFSFFCSRAIKKKCRVRSRVSKMRFLSVLGSNFNWCTTLGVTLIEECTRASKRYFDQGTEFLIHRLPHLLWHLCSPTEQEKYSLILSAYTGSVERPLSSLPYLFLTGAVYLILAFLFFLLSKNNTTMIQAIATDN